MKKFTTAIIAIFMLVAFSFTPGCKNKGEKVEKETYETPQPQPEETESKTDLLQKSIEELRAEVEKLQKDVDQLTFEKQKLLAEKKRLEAEVIELRIGIKPTPTPTPKEE
jgi:peptidoglycan hydrolase CwlO-like protein